MRHFPLCPACHREYTDPADRRFHAEPNACPVCGPRVRLLRVQAEPAPGDGGGQVTGTREPGRQIGETIELSAGTPEDPSLPVRLAGELLRAGEILAVKGLGGFHLACDATDGEVVRRLKERKRRPDKPLAVMFRDLEQLRSHCVAGREEAELLTSPEHPIVLLPWREIREDGAVGPELGEVGEGAAVGPPPGTAARRAVDPEVAVGQRYLGAMLPYTPLHVLFLDWPENGGSALLAARQSPSRLCLRESAPRASGYRRRSTDCRHRC